MVFGMSARLRITFATLCFVFLTSLWIGSADAQQAVPTTQDTPAAETIPDLSEMTNHEAIRDVISKLDDGQVRELLITELDRRVAGEVSEGASIATFLSQTGSNLLTSWTFTLERVPHMFRSLYRITVDFFANNGWSGSLMFLLAVGLAIGLGLAAERLVRHLLGNLQRMVEQRNPEGLWPTVRTLFLRLFLDLLGILVFMLVVRSVMLLMPVSDANRDVVRLLILSMFLPIKFAQAISRFISAPQRPDLRLITATDDDARYFNGQLVLIAGLVGLLNFMTGFQFLQGLQPGETRLGFWLNLAYYIAILNLLWHGRDAIRRCLIGEDEHATDSLRRLAQIWPFIAMGIVIANWLLVETIVSLGRFDLLRGQEHIVMILVIMAPVFDTMIRGLVRHLHPPLTGEGIIAERAHAASRHGYVRIGRVLFIVAGIVIIALSWNIDLNNLAESGFGARFAGLLIETIFILAAGYLAWEVVTLWINGKLAREMSAAGIDMDSEELGNEGGEAAGSRLSTVLPLILGTLQAAIIIVTVLLALSHMGLDITPLLAGAGIIGLAIGFGAQTLVRDVVSGIFFLVDDAFRQGEYIEVGEIRGTVEKISVRSVQLRHHKGAVHTVPYGEIPKLTNYSRDWVIMKLRFTVPFDTDTEKVRKLFKKLGQAMATEDAFKDDFIQPFKSQGVLEFDDTGIVLRGKFMAKPGRQFVLRKEILRRVQEVFDANGIEFARKEVRVRVSDKDNSLEEEDKQVIGAAAADKIAPQPAE